MLQCSISEREEPSALTAVKRRGGCLVGVNVLIIDFMGKERRRESRRCGKRREREREHAFIFAF